MDIPLALANPKHPWALVFRSFVRVMDPRVWTSTLPASVFTCIANRELFEEGSETPGPSTVTSPHFSLV